MKFASCLGHADALNRRGWCAGDFTIQLRFDAGLRGKYDVG